MIVLGQGPSDDGEQRNPEKKADEIYLFQTLEPSRVGRSAKGVEAMNHSTSHPVARSEARRTEQGSAVRTRKDLVRPEAWVYAIAERFER
jgi:hypothetical protein